jgi:short chain dehydrogenase
MPNDRRRFDKFVFVTGAANGIGRAAALAFAREGVSVAAADISDRGNRETARMIEEAGGRARAVKCDVSRDNDVKTALEKTRLQVPIHIPRMSSPRFGFMNANAPTVRGRSFPFVAAPPYSAPRGSAEGTLTDMALVAGQTLIAAMGRRLQRPLTMIIFRQRF